MAALCETLQLPHTMLTVEWASKPETALQERARMERYRLLGRWAADANLPAVATAHHLDDQAETLLMRLNRGAGAGGLAGMRESAPLPFAEQPLLLLRPLLGWGRLELVNLCESAGVNPVDDPSNADEQFERVRVRNALAEAEWLDPEAIARSAANLAGADAALDWATELEWERQVAAGAKDIAYRPSAPPEIQRRIVRRAVSALATEGEGNPLRGRELDRLVATLSSGGTATLRGVLCSGGGEWTFTEAPPRGR